MIYLVVRKLFHPVNLAKVITGFFYKGNWCNGCTLEFGSKRGVSTTSFPTKLFIL